MNVAEKHDFFSLSYHYASCHPSSKGRKKFNSVRFSSAGYQYDLSIIIVDDENSNKPAVSDFIRKCPLGFKLDNWTSIVVLKVFSKEM